MLSVEQVLREGLVERFPGVPVSVSFSPVGITADRIIILTVRAVPVDGAVVAGKYTVDVTCLARTVGVSDSGGAFEFAGEVLAFLKEFIESGRAKDFTGWFQPLSLPFLVDNRASSRGHIAVQFAFNTIAYFG